MSAFLASLRPGLRASSTAALSARSFSNSAAHNAAKIMITGRLAAEPELVATSSGKEMLRYAVGSTYGSRENRTINWFRVNSFVNEGPQRDYLLGLPKGTLVFVEGDASMRQWEDNEGRRQSTLSILQRSIEVLKRPYTGPDNESGESQQE
ncbi:single-stranded DNA-binding protein [Aspergillus candidus]|uniref:Putative ssDNA binding protein n=1 Tax=Aspergillus candidus TaxID=41067 RepID=A0A2I2F0F5_ASPCN|nr:putative ssDNA binding protein [Aspergillus candidus]PLB34104.1 putative ssDNA binding protein [Aspergillus candidus]